MESGRNIPEEIVKKIKALTKKVSSLGHVQERKNMYQ
jgi:hypothetical protein